MAFKDLFKRKEGGTLVGNIIRTTANSKTGGLLGNGAMMLKPGQTAQQSNNAMVHAAVKAVNDFQTDVKNAPNTKPTATSIKDYLTLSFIKSKMAYIIGGLVVIFGVVFYFIRKNKTNKRRR